MRLAGMAIVRNEGDIIESFVRHNLTFLDELYIINHRSTDGTGEILAALCAEGLPVKVFVDHEVGFFQGERMNNLCRQVFRLSTPNFIFMLDADEFIRAPSRNILHDILAMLPPDSHALIPWKTHVPTEWDDMKQSNPILRIRHRREIEQQQYYKVIVSNYFMREPGQIVTQGNHAVLFEDDRPIKHAKLRCEISLSHYPVRSEEQLISKILLGWLSHIAIKRDQSEQSYHWRNLYHRLMRDPHLSMADLREIAMTYSQSRVVPDGAFSNSLVDDPLPIVVENRYDNYRKCDPLLLVMHFAERLVRGEESIGML